MLVQFQLKDRILVLNADNAASNDTQTTALAAMDNTFAEAQRVRCFNHTLQLSAKALLRPFNAALGKSSGNINMVADEDCEDDILGLDNLDDDDLDDLDDEDMDEVVEELAEDDDVVQLANNTDDGIDELQELSENERASIIRDTAVVRTTISKIRDLSFAIICSTTLALPAWKEKCKESNLTPNLIPRDVVTRWNSTHDMLVFTLKYREPIDNITSDKSFKLRKYELDNDDWMIIEELVSLLEQYKKATVFFSSDSASIASVIPIMDKIDSRLNSHSKKPYPPSIIAAMKLAYRVTMVLHPGLKLQYFRLHEWEDEWIEAVEDLVREEYVSKYEGKAAQSHSEDTVTEEVEDAEDDDFGNISVVKNTTTLASELDAYLNVPIENVKDPLQWWVSHEATYPNLSRMALDYLSIPGELIPHCTLLITNPLRSNINSC
jgi:hAT family C-terminal dimerisation region